MKDSRITVRDETAQYRIVVNSIGSARPAASAAIAKGLGLAASTVVSRLYRAPAILVEGVDHNVARQVTNLLCDIGYQAEIQDLTQPVPPRSPLYDVALYVEDADAFLPTVKAISKFIGMPEADASTMLMMPPGIVLGSVSKATVEAFRQHLDEGVSMVSSIADEASYDIFLGDVAEIVSRRILSDLRDANITPISDSGLVAAAVDHQTAQALWRRHQASGAMRVVNRDFLRFDLVCTDIESGFETASPQQIECLERVAGIPADLVPEVLNSLPITLLEAVPNGAVEQRMTELAEVGLVMRADLISFQLLTLEILSISQPAATLSALTGYGVFKQGAGLPRVPFKLDGVMPELQARLLKAALEMSGAEVDFVEEAQ